MFTKIRIALVFIFFSLIVFYSYNTYLAKTNIAFVNFKDYIFANFAEQEQGLNVKTFQLNIEDLTKNRFRKYKAIYIFGMGLNLSDEQLKKLKKASKRGTKIFVFAANNLATDINNLSGKDIEYIQDYFQNGGRKNYKNILAYTRHNFDQKKLFKPEYDKPQVIPNDLLFHIDENAFFVKLEDYEKYYKEKGFYKHNAPKVMIYTTNLGPRNPYGRAQVDELIRQLEAKGFNVYPCTGFLNKLDYLTQVKPDIVLYMPHGRFVPGKGDQVIETFKKLNIPLICPINIFDDHDKWLKSQQGMVGGIMSQSIVMPELDGGIEPFVIGAQFVNEKGFKVFKPIPNRIEKLVERINNWVNLQKKENKDKKISIFYYKGPGLASMVAAGMDVNVSLFRLLQYLREYGFTVEDLPETEEEFFKIIQEQGINIGDYAKGTFEKYLQNGKPELVPLEGYLQWAKNNLEPEMYQSIVEQYGEAGNGYMTTEIGGKKYLIIARIVFGNISILPQPLPGNGDNDFQLIHGAKKAPPHNYVAPYLWVKEGFKSDAIMHFGTHGSLEFTPWKQVALSQYDWPEALIGTLPHIYLYVINNIGEAVIAKRRSYATLVSHLTPPFMESDLYGDFIDMHDNLHLYYQTEDFLYKEILKESIIKSAIELNLDKDLSISLDVSNISDDIIDKIHQYIHSVEENIVPRGLYVLGESYAPEYLEETVRMISVYPISSALSKLDLLDKKVTQKQLDDKHFFEQYREKAMYIIESILKNKKAPKDFIPQNYSKFLENYSNKNNYIDSDSFLANMLSISESEINIVGKKYSKEELLKIIVNIASDIEKKNYILSLTNEKEFEKASSLLDEQQWRRFERIAKTIRKMNEVLIMMEKPGVKDILRAMQDNQTKEYVFNMLSDSQILEKVQQEKIHKETEIVNWMQAKDNTNIIFDVFRNKNIIKTLNKSELKERVKIIEAYLKNYQLLFDSNVQIEQNKQLRSLLHDDSARNSIIKHKNHINLLIEEKENFEKEYAEAIILLSDTLYDIKNRYFTLKNSPTFEIKGLINALSGGYIAPSTGGDPVFNPKSIPTGRNLVAIDAEATPDENTYRLGSRLAQSLIDAKLNSTGEYPQKIAFTLWGGEFIRGRGVELGQIFYLLGVEPVRNSRGSVFDVRLIPTEQLDRPRIDVVVQTSGQFRDIAASRLYLIDKAVKLAANAPDSAKYPNFVKKGVLDAEQSLKEQGLSPVDARKFSTVRVFGGVNGNYGTAISGLVESGDKWNNTSEIAQQYLKNMGAIYTEENWSYFDDRVFSAALLNTDTIVQPRSSNLWGLLSLDHAYEFSAALSNAIYYVTGKDPDAYVSDLRNPHQAKIQTAKEAIWVEARTTFLNPKYVEAMQEQSGSGAEEFAETFRNMYAWNALKPREIDKELWDNTYEMFMDDKYQLDILEYFKEKNPYAFQEMTAVMLETIRKGLWVPEQHVIDNLANLHAEFVESFEAGCSGFVCNNNKLSDFISQLLSEEKRNNYQDKLNTVKEANLTSEDAIVMKKEETFLTQIKEILENNTEGIFLIIGIIAFILFAILKGMRKRGD
jgi:cobaltochelatase CobN